jgi:hypothetical protein
MVTGQVPFENASPLDCWMKKINNEFAPPKELNVAISERVDWAIRRAMSAEPDRRPASCREFVEDLTGQSRSTPTRPGLGQSPTVAAVDIWYLVYKDENGTTHTSKGSTEGIRKALQDQLLGDTSSILISRTKTGQFSLVASVPEFRDLVLSPAPVPVHGVRSAEASGMLAKASGVVPRPGPASDRHRRQPAFGENEPNTPLPDGDGSSGSRAGRAGIPGPSRALPSTKQTPTSTSSGRRAVLPTPDPADSGADTSDHNPGAIPESQLTPARQAGLKSSRDLSGQKKQFDWTPILLIVVMLLSAVIGYLVLNR